MLRFVTLLLMPLLAPGGADAKVTLRKAAIVQAAPAYAQAAPAQPEPDPQTEAPAGAAPAEATDSAPVSPEVLMLQDRIDRQAAVIKNQDLLIAALKQKLAAAKAKCP